MGEKDEENKVRRGDGDSRVEVDHAIVHGFAIVHKSRVSPLMQQREKTTDMALQPFFRYKQRIKLSSWGANLGSSHESRGDEGECRRGLTFSKIIYNTLSTLRTNECDLSRVAGKS